VLGGSFGALSAARGFASLKLPLTKKAKPAFSFC